jgi:hypothetical protein
VFNVFGVGWENRGKGVRLNVKTSGYEKAICFPGSLKQKLTAVLK